MRGWWEGKDVLGEMFHWYLLKSFILHHGLDLNTVLVRAWRRGAYFADYKYKLCVARKHNHIVKNVSVLIVSRKLLLGPFSLYLRVLR